MDNLTTFGFIATDSYLYLLSTHELCLRISVAYNWLT